MDGFPLDLTIFLTATFVSAFVAGLSGFAFGLVAASIWLYILTPLQTATLSLEAPPLAQLGQALAVPNRGSDWRAGWRDHSDVGKSRPRASRHWSFFNRVQSLRSLSSCYETDHGRRRAR